MRQRPHTSRDAQFQYRLQERRGLCHEVGLLVDFGARAPKTIASRFRSTRSEIDHVWE